MTDTVARRNEPVLALYSTMRRSRRFDERLIPLISGFFHSGAGQEAIGAGVASQLRRDDYLIYSHRGCTEIIAKGLPLGPLYADFFNRVGGTCRGKGAGIVHVAEPEYGVLGQSGTLGGCFPIALGAATSAKFAGRRQVAVCFFGEGTSSRGTFHESLNWAAVKKVPLILVCENNGWAISARAEDTIAGTMLGRAAAYGIPGEQVDGQDVLAVYAAGNRAIEHARAGNGPYFIEALTHRMLGHHIGDDQKYRPAADIELAKSRDPIVLYRKKLVEFGVSQEQIAAMDQEIEREIDAAIAEAQASPAAGAEVAFADVYA